MRNATTLSLRRSLLASTVAAVTMWACLLTWRPLLEQPLDYVAPLLVTGTAIALVGAVARWRGVRPAGVLGLELLVAVPALLLWTVGTPWPTPAALQELLQTLTRGVDSANRYAAPVPADVPPVAPLFLAAGVGAVLVVDLVALSLRRVPVTGLIVLVLHLVPINLGVQVAWWLFAMVTAGFLVLLFLDQDDLVVRWGEDVQDRERGTTTRPPVAEGAGGATAARIGLLAGVGAVALTLALTTLVPQAPARQWSGGGGGDDGQISLTSPLVDMRRDLVRGLDMPLLTVNGDRRPTYVRTAVLAEFDGAEWSTGDRRATRIQAANGTPLTLNGVDVRLQRTETDYVFTATDLFRSRWLPVMSSTSAVRAEGDWRYDREMMDFASFDEELSTSGMSWDVVGVDLEHSAVALDRAPSGLSQVDSTFTELPRALPTSIEALAETVAGDEPTRFRQARALQSWFRSEFTYSLDRAEAVGSNELVAFLDERGRVGYCEQFAAAMAVMARTLGIPSRVAVGFLSPEQVGPGAWEFSSYDLHAWPELYFAGAGWVRFEPTPASRASGVPDYSRDSVEPIEDPSAAPTPTAEPTPAAPPPEARDRVSDPGTDDEVSSGPSWRRIATASGLLALLSLLVLAPQWVRRRRRAHRLASGSAEELWAELRDSSVDLGFSWPAGRSPRALGAHVSQWSSAPDLPGARPQKADEAVDVMVLVEAVERERYARADQRGAHAPSGLADVVTACVAALRGNASRAARWRARWIPVSLASKRRSGQ